MKKGLFIAIILIFMLLAFSMAASSAAACGKRKKTSDNGRIAKEYGNIELTGGIETNHFDDIWNLTAGEMKITFTYDATGLIDDGFDLETYTGTIALGLLGIRDTTATDLEPFEKGVWLNTFYDPESDTFDPDKFIDTDWDNIPDTKADNIFDLDDQLMLQRGGPNWDETDYDLPAGQGDRFLSSGIWFDRDGVNATEAQRWDFRDGVSYNTSGIYQIELLLKATSKTTGEAYLTINGMKQGFWEDEWTDTEPDIYPAGMTFNGDMENMQIFYGLFGYGAVHRIFFNNTKVVQSIEYDLNLEIKLSVIDSVIDYKIIKNIPEDVKIFFDLDVKPKVKPRGDIKLDIKIKINIKDNVKVNVNLDFEVIVSGSKNDVDVDIDLSIENAADVRFDGLLKVTDVKDDATIDVDFNKVKDCSDVFIYTTITATNIGEDADIEVEIDKIEECSNVHIYTTTTATSIGEDADIEVEIDKIRKCSDVTIDSKIEVDNIVGDAKIVVEIDKVKDCSDVTIDTEIEGNNIDDDAKINIDIDDVEDCTDIQVYIKAALDYIGDDVKLMIDVEVVDCDTCDYDVNIIPPTTMGGDYKKHIDFDID